MSIARHPLRFLLLVVLGLSALTVQAQVFVSNGSFIGLLNDELVPSGKPYFCERLACTPPGRPRSLVLVTLQARLV